MARQPAFKQHELMLLYRLHQIYGYSYDATARFIGRSNAACVNHFLNKFTRKRREKPQTRLQKLYKSQRLRKNIDKPHRNRCLKCRQWFWSPSKYIRRCDKCKAKEKLLDEYYGCLDEFPLRVP